MSGMSFDRRQKPSHEPLTESVNTPLLTALGIEEIRYKGYQTFIGVSPDLGLSCTNVSIRRDSATAKQLMGQRIESTLGFEAGGERFLVVALHSRPPLHPFELITEEHDVSDITYIPERSMAEKLGFDFPG